MSWGAALTGAAQWDVLTGDALETLRSLPAGVAQTCVTSPPYWGLRAYQTDPLVWGGDPGCDHAWMSNGAKPGGSQKQGATSLRIGRTNVADQATTGVELGATCGRCGAWRGELGLEPTAHDYVCHLVDVLREVKRVLRADGTCWLNIGDSYAGSGRGPQGQGGSAKASYWTEANHRKGLPLRGTKGVPSGYGGGTIPAKSLALIPERLAIALSDDGWIVRSRIAWCKTAPMPEPVEDRPTTAWEHVWLLAKGRRYYYDRLAVRQEAEHGRRDVKGTFRGGAYVNQRGPVDNTTRPDYSNSVTGKHPETGRNLWNYWLFGPEPYMGAHFATFPTALPDRCIRAGTRPGDVVLDPFAGSGRTLVAALRRGRRALGIELNPANVELARRQIVDDAPLWNHQAEGSTPP